MHVERINMRTFMKLLREAILKNTCARGMQCVLFLCLMHRAVVSQNPKRQLAIEHTSRCSMKRMFADEPPGLYRFLWDRGNCPQPENSRIWTAGSKNCVVAPAGSMYAISNTIKNVELTRKNACATKHCRRISSLQKDEAQMWRWRNERLG